MINIFFAIHKDVHDAINLLMQIIMQVLTKLETLAFVTKMNYGSFLQLVGNQKHKHS